MSALRIVFAGTPEFAASALQALLDTPHTIVAVYTQPDRPAGRGRQLKASPVKELALQHHLPVEQPASLKDADAQLTLERYQADVMIVAAYGLLLPKAVLDMPRYGCLNIHASLLPRWRGAAPIQRAILHGDAHTGITIMQMDVGLDTGAMLLKKTIRIGEHETAGELHDRLAQLGAHAIVESLQQLTDLQKQSTAQDETLATYAKKLAKEEAWIHWSQPAAHIDRQIRAFNPWPITQSTLDNTIIRIWQANVLTTQQRHNAGTITEVTKQGITVACGEGALQITRAQLPGGKPLSIAEILNGHANLLQIGKCFDIPIATSS